MELSNWVALWCAAMTTCQGIAAFYEIVDRRNLQSKSARKAARKPTPLAVSSLLLLGTVVTIAFGCWMFFGKPLRPTQKTVTVTIEKAIPCLPTKTGDVRVDGKGNVGSSGNDAHINDPNDKK